MGREINRLNHRRAVALTTRGLHADGGGLYLQIGPSGTKSWAFIYRWRGQRRQMGLGAFPTILLTDAREAATWARKQLSDGLNPIEVRKASRVTGQTFGQAADDLIAALKPGWKNPKHAQQWETTLAVDCAPLRPLAVAEVDTDAILGVLKPIWTTKPETAGRIRGRIERVLDAAKAKGHRSGENPARWKGHLEHSLAKRQKLSRGHHPALPFAEAPAFLSDLRKREGVAALLLEFTILTACRTTEGLLCEPGEFDLSRAIWTVPPERMKMGLPHRVALCARAVEIVRALIEEAPHARYVFSKADGEPLSSGAMTAVLKRMDRDDISVHGFRSTFRDWAGECTSFPESVAEAALAHQVGTETERAYRRGDALEKRRKLMAAWQGYLERPQAPNVVGIRRA